MYNMLWYQYRYENFHGNMSVYNEFLGTCHFSMLEWLEYIPGEMTWNNISEPLLLQEEVWQCWYVVKVIILIMISLCCNFRKMPASNWLTIQEETRLSLWHCTEDYIYTKMDTTDMIYFCNNTIHLFRHEKCISMTESQFEKYKIFPEDEVQWEKIQQHIYI